MRKLPMKPIPQLKIRDKVSPRFLIDKNRVKHWKYAKECPDNFASINAGAEMEIAELPGNPRLDGLWIKVYLPNTHNTMTLKIDGGELSSLFQLLG